MAVDRRTTMSGLSRNRRRLDMGPACSDRGAGRGHRAAAGGGGNLPLALCEAAGSAREVSLPLLRGCRRPRQRLRHRHRREPRQLDLRHDPEHGRPGHQGERDAPLGLYRRPDQDLGRRVVLQPDLDSGRGDRPGQAADREGDRQRHRRRPDCQARTATMRCRAEC